MKVREIERLRAFAVLMVIWTHSSPPLTGFAASFFGLPRTGVDLFFVISGFVVSRSLVRLLPDLTDADGLATAFDRSREALKRFYTRRFFRIVPLAVAAMVAFRLLVTLGVQPKASVDGFWHEVLAIATGVYNYAHPYPGYGQMFVYWSLSVEEHFYLLLPLGFLLARTRTRRAGLALAGAAFVALVCRNLFDSSPPGANAIDYRLYSSHLRFDALLAGVAIAMLFDGAPSAPIMPPRFVKCVVVPVCLALICSVPGQRLPLDSYFHQGLTATWLFCGVLVTYASFDRGYVFDVPVLGRVLEHVGARSYAMYLLHIPVVRCDEALVKYVPSCTLFKAEHPWTHWGLVLLAIVAVSELSWHLLELPTQQLGRRLSDPSLPPWRLGPRRFAAFAMVGAAVVLAQYRHSVERWLGPPNLALHAQVTSSPWDAGKPPPANVTNGDLDYDGAFETMADQHPWILIDLGRVTPIKTIVTYNRYDGYQDEVLPLTVELSSDGEDFDRVSTRRRIFSQWFPWRLSLGGREARYVRYTGAGNGFISIAECEVYAP